MKTRIAMEQMFITLGQQCNSNCAHCQCGGSRDVFMSRETMKRIFDEVAGVGNLYLAGGESQMPGWIDACNELAGVIKECGADVDHFRTHTNASVCDENWQRALVQLENQCSQKRNKCMYFISNDRFHKRAIPKLVGEKTYENNIEHLKKSRFFNGIAAYCDEFIIAQGRATGKKFLDGVPALDPKLLQCTTYPIALTNETDGARSMYVNALCFGVSGDVIVDSDFTTQVENALGNVHDANIFDIVTSHPQTRMCHDANGFFKTVNVNADENDRLIQLGIAQRRFEMQESHK